MSDRMIPVPESLVLDAVSLLLGSDCSMTAEDLRACLPEPEPTFTDKEALAFQRTLWPLEFHPTTDWGREYLTRLAKAGWTAPKALCPPPSPALVELVEAARGYVENFGTLDRLRAAVAAYDEQEG